MQTKYKISRSGIAFDGINYLFMILLCLTTLYPFIFLLSLSLDENAVFNLAQLSIIPKQISIGYYKKVLSNEYVLSGFFNTFLRTGIGTPLTVIATLFCAYPLSKKYFPHRALWTGLIVLTMFFSGGLIPRYLLVKYLNLNDKIWALILPGLINTFTMIIMRNYLMTIPDSLEESARIDGATDTVILFRIIVPISVPIIATVALWTAVDHWNAWFDSLIYIGSSKKQVLQIVLRRIVLEGTSHMMELNSRGDSYTNTDSLKSATVMVATLPIVAVYPFVQKFFIKGIMIGSLKG